MKISAKCVLGTVMNPSKTTVINRLSKLLQMAQINIDDSSKEWFDEFKEDDETQADAFDRMVQQVKAFEGEPVDHEELAEQLSHTLIPRTELAAYRGCNEAIENNGD